MGGGFLVKPPCFHWWRRLHFRCRAPPCRTSPSRQDSDLPWDIFLRWIYAWDLNPDWIIKCNILRLHNEVEPSSAEDDHHANNQGGFYERVGNLLDQERFPAREVDFLHSSSPQHLKPSFCLLQQVHVKFCHWSLIMAVCAIQWNLSWQKKTDFSIDAQQIYYLSHSKLFPCVLVRELRRWFKRYEGDKFLTTTTSS